MRAANARLRRVVEAKDTEIAGLRAAMEAGRARQAEVIRRLELRVAELQRRLGMDSRNSSTPLSKEPLAAKARRTAARRASLRERSAQRKPGGQPGHEGSGLEPERDPDRTEQAEPPAECRSCGAGLADAGPASRGWGQVWDIPPVRLEKVHWLLPRLRCAACGKVTTADPPGGRAGTVVYGPNVNAAAILLSSEGNVPVERTAMLMEALLGAPASAGFVARAHERLADRLEQAGFDEAMRAALRAEPVMCADETPVNVIRTTGGDGAVAVGSPHAITVRTPGERLVWYAATPSRSSEAIKSLCVVDAYHGSWSATTTPAGPSSTPSSPGCSNAASTYHATSRASAPCTRTGSTGPKRSARSCATPTAPSRTPPPPGKPRWTPACSRTCGNATTPRCTGARSPTGSATGTTAKTTPGYILARRLKTKAEQVWLFTRDFAVPWTNNASEQAIKGPKRHQAISGYWHFLATLARYCRVRSYLVTSRNHGIQPIDAIHTALTGRPWLPTTPAIA